MAAGRRSPDADASLRTAVLALSGLAADAPEVDELAYWAGEFTLALLGVMLKQEGQICAIVKDHHCTQMAETVTRKPQKNFRRRSTA